MTAAHAAPRPGLWNSLLEVRALAEMASVRTARPLLKRAASGDGHPVLVFPGFFAADRSTASLRRYLQGKGFSSYAWGQGRNPGMNDELYQRLERLAELRYQEHGRKVSLVGWSLGGIYARLLANRRPELVRQVVTLGSPFKLRVYDAVQGPVARLYQQMNPQQAEDPMMAHQDLWHTPPPVPSTAIYSQGDGVTHWSYCMDDEDHETENIRLPGSHTGMTHNPLVMYAVVDRLAQPEGEWRPFQWRRALRRRD